MRFTISKKISLINAIYMLSIMIVALAVFLASKAVYEDFKVMNTNWNITMALDSLQLWVNKLTMAESRYFYSRNQTSYLAWVSAYNKVIAIVDKVDSKIELSEQQDALQDFNLALFEYKKAFRKSHELLSKSINNAFATDFKVNADDSFKKTDMLSAVMNQAVADIIAMNSKLINGRLQEATTLLENTKIVSVLIVVIGLASAIFLAAFITNKISKPITLFSQLASRISNKNFDVTLDKALTVNNDEIGDLARSFNKMTNNLQDTIMKLVLEVERRKMVERRLQQQSEELLTSNKELEQFAYVASHDLKAPLRGIDNLAKWIEEDLTEANICNGEIKGNIVTLRGRVKRLESLLTDLLAYSRAGRIEEKVELVDTYKIITEIYDYIAPAVKFKLNLSTELPCINTHKAPLEQVFRNLINNAIKHHDKDSGCITITAEEQGDYFAFFVADDGPGIPPKFHKRVFMMFQTLKPRDIVEGSGMGLAMVKRIVESYGGRITITSELTQRGTTFMFTWPK